MRTSFYDSVDQSPETDALHSHGVLCDNHLTGKSCAESREVRGAMCGISFFPVILSFLEAVPSLLARCLR